MSCRLITGAVAVALIAGCAGEGGESAESAASAESEIRRTDPFRYLGLFDPEPMEILDCLDQTPIPVGESPEVISLIEMHQEMTPGVEPIEYIFVDLLVVGIEEGNDARLDVREVYRAGIEGMACPDPDEPASASLFSLQGNEPFWGIEIRRDSLTLTRMGEAPVTVAHQGITGSAGAGWSIRAETPTAELAIELLNDGCRDSMAGGFFELAVTVTWGDESWTGCGWRPTIDE